MNAALAAQIPRRVYRRACDIAIDFHDRPYYGRSLQEEGLWVRGKAKNGTTRFYRVATAYVILTGLRVTLAVAFFLPGNDTVTSGILVASCEDTEYPSESPVFGQRICQY